MVEDERDEDTEIKILHRLDPIHTWQGNQVSGTLTVRIIEWKGKVFLDVREYRKTPAFEGYTKRGLRLTAREISRMIEMLPQAQELVNQELHTRISNKGQKGWNSQSATAAAARRKISN